jgi:hypothetical protein
MSWLTPQSPVRWPESLCDGSQNCWSLSEKNVKPLALVCGVLVWAYSGSAFAQKATREEILALYSFSPHTLSKEAQSQKSAALDTFWEKVKGERKAYVPVLQELLRATNVPAFFLFDGSRLLLDLSDTAENRQIAVGALARCDLRDVDRTVYLQQVHSLATTGTDTTDAAFHILDDPEFKAFIPQHALTLGQDFCLILTLFPTDSSYWLQRAIKRLETEPNHEAQKSLVHLLWYAQFSESDAAVASFSTAADKPSASREFARELSGRNGKLAARGRRTLKSKETEASIRKARVKILSRISDEALSEFDEETLKLIAIRSKSAYGK